MDIKRWSAILAAMVFFLLLPLPAACESDTQVSPAQTHTVQNGFSLDDVEISVNGLPLEDVLNTASGMFADAVEKNMGEAINGINGVLSGFAEGFSAALEQMDDTIGSLINETWRLKIPVLSVDTQIKRSTYGNALDLYNAQIAGKTGKGARIAWDNREDCGNNIIYIYDEGKLAAEVLAAVEDGTFGDADVFFGSDGGQAEYSIVSVLYLTPSDDPFAPCNMSDVRDQQRFDAFSDYIFEHAFKSYDDDLWDGVYLLTVIFWGPNSDDGWLAVVGQEEPMMLE